MGMRLILSINLACFHFVFCWWQELNVEQEPNPSVFTLSSDSESGQGYRPVNEDQIHHGESSDQKTSEFQGGAKGDDDALIGSDGESPSKKASKEKSPRKRLKVEGHTPIKEKKINENIEKKGMKLGLWQVWIVFCSKK